jgi:hypothetical protein
MKKASILLSLIAILSIASLTVNAQVTATATSSATIITPIAISKVTDLNFGNVAVSPTIAGTVVLDNTSARTKTGGVTLPVVAGTVSAAKFTVTGLSGSTFSISLPAAPITLTDAGSHTMTVGTFTSTPTAAGTLTGGTMDILVGATLNVSSGQAAGLYTNAAGLAVTVNYN